MKIWPLIAAMLVANQPLLSQDLAYSRKVIDKLCAHKYHGRGYIKNGAIQSSTFIAKEMKKAGIKSVKGTYFQKFEMVANTLPIASILDANHKSWIPGVDFQVGADAPSYKGAIDIKPDACVTATLLTDSVLFDKKVVEWYNRGDKWIVIDTLSAEIAKKYHKQLLGLKAHFHSLSFVSGKFTWTVAPKAIRYINIDLHYSSKVNIQVLSKCVLHIESRELTSLQRNVVGWIPGTEQPDSFMMITAHYDHLGEMGKAMFPGANDNAAGVAMLLDLGKYYAQHPPRYSMVFVAFAGEEAGLIGSYHYVQNPAFPLAKTRFLLNLDLVGTGETGMTVVNATTFPREFSVLDSLNKQFQYLPNIARRGKAANSDHYYFTEAGVPSFFWYQGGPRSSYHDVHDIPQTLTLAGYEGTFRLAVQFLNGISRP